MLVSEQLSCNFFEATKIRLFLEFPNGKPTKMNLILPDLHTKYNFQNLFKIRLLNLFG